jgi:hypothetical protein
VKLKAALGLAALAVVLYVSIRTTRDLTDFKVYLTAGQRALHAEPLYRDADGFFQYKYLPAFALLISPLSTLDPQAARVVWFGLSFGLLLLFVGASVRARPEHRLSDNRVLLLLLLVMAKDYIRELSLGQTNVLFGVIVLVAMLAATRAQRGAAGGWIAVSIFVKPYGVLFTPWLVWAAGLRAVGVCLAIVLAGLALPALVYGWNGNLVLLAGWYHTVTTTTGATLLRPENVSFASMWAKWIGVGSAASLLALATTAITVAAVVVTAFRRREPTSAAAYLDAAALLILVPLISPQGWDYVLLLATPAVVILLDRWPLLTRTWKAAIATALGLVALPSRDLFGLTLHQRFLSTAVVSVAAIVLWGATLATRRAVTLPRTPSREPQYPASSS